MQINHDVTTLLHRWESTIDARAEPQQQTGPSNPKRASRKRLASAEPGSGQPTAPAQIGPAFRAAQRSMHPSHPQARTHQTRQTPGLPNPGASNEQQQPHGTSPCIRAFPPPFSISPMKTQILIPLSRIPQTHTSLGNLLPSGVPFPSILHCCFLSPVETNGLDPSTRSPSTPPCPPNRKLHPKKDEANTGVHPNRSEVEHT